MRLESILWPHCGTSSRRSWRGAPGDAAHRGDGDAEMGGHGENLKLHVQSLGRKRLACVPQWRSMRCLPAVLSLLALLTPALAQKRLVLIDQDGSGPGGSNQMAMMVLLQSPQVEVLGITIVTGNAWRDEETLHTLRMLELTGHAAVPVARGAVFPLVRTQEETRLATALYGKVTL